MTAAPTSGAHPCPRCAEPCPDGARYCSRCGMGLAGIPEAPPSAPAPVVVTPPLSAAPPIPGPYALGPPSAPVHGWVPAHAAGPVVVAAPLSAPGVPSVVGRRASRAGWIGVALGGLAFLAASAAVVVLAPEPTEPTPLARWDRMLRNPGTIADGEPFPLTAEAVNPGEAVTGPLWMVMDWQPDDAALDPDVVGQLVACEPVDCHFRDDPADGRTLVYWPGLPPGGRELYTVTVRLTGIDPGSTFPYRVRVGTGPDESSLGDTRTWSPEPEVDESP
jgi:hypothetical protein